MPKRYDPAHDDKAMQNSDNQNTMNIPVQPYRDNTQTNVYRRQSPKPVKKLKRNGSQSQMSQTSGSRQQYQGQQPYSQPYQNGQYSGSQPYQGQQQYSQPYQNPQYSGSQPYQGQQQYSQPYQNGQYSGSQPYQGQPQYSQPYPNGQYYSRQYQSQQAAPVYQQQPRQYYGDQYAGSVSPQPAPRYRPQKRRKQKKHKSLAGKIIKRIIFSLLTLIFTVFAMYSCTSLVFISKINKEPTGSRDRTKGAVSRSYVTNVLIIGTDGRSADEQGRSDSMIVVSLNSKTNELTMASFLRDCYVDIPGYGWDKLNASYSYGGAELLMDTIEKNFYIKIDNYVNINFMTFTDIVDAVGGITLSVSDEEAEAINIILQSEVNELMGDDPFDDFLQSGGKLKLNGKQALSYARIRYVGNADFERTSRQREVFSKIIDKVKHSGPIALKNIAGSVFPKLTTNMSTMKMYLLSLRLPFLLGYDMKQLQIPADGTFYGEDVETFDGGYQNVLIVDYDANADLIEDEMYSK